jgi:hypothetical protein
VALRANGMNAEAALQAVGGKLERHPVTREVITLNLARSRINNEDLEHMAEFFQPRELDLTDTDITDRASSHLAGWTSLRILKLGRTRMSTKTVKQLKYYSPGLDIR